MHNYISLCLAALNVHVCSRGREVISRSLNTSAISSSHFLKRCSISGSFLPPGCSEWKPRWLCREEKSIDTHFGLLHKSQWSCGYFLRLVATSWEILFKMWLRSVYSVSGVCVKAEEDSWLILFGKAKHCCELDGGNDLYLGIFFTFWPRPIARVVGRFFSSSLTASLPSHNYVVPLYCLTQKWRKIS